MLCGAALSAVALGFVGPQTSAHADIGLVKGGRGTAYVTILGGYQHRDGGAAVAPSAPGGVNPFPGGLDVEAQAIATPDQVSAKTRVGEANRSAAASASATPDSAMVEDSTQQEIAGTQARTSTSARGNSDSVAGSASGVISEGNKQAEASSSFAASLDLMVDSQSAASAQEATNSANANAAASAIIGDPSLAKVAGEATANNDGPNEFPPPLTDPVSISRTANAQDIPASTTASAEGDAATSGGEATSFVRSSAQAGGASAFAPANARADDGAAMAGTDVETVIDGSNGTQSDAGGGAFSDGTFSAVTQSQSFIDGNLARALTTAIGNPGSFLLASTVAILDPGGPVRATALYDSEMLAPSAAVSLTDADLNPQETLITNLANQNLEAEDGAFGGGTLGYVFVHPVLGLIDRAEGYVARARNEDDRGERSIVFVGVSADGQAIAAAFNSNGLEIQTREVLTQTELGLRLKSDRYAQGPLPLIVSAEPFYMRYEHEARYGVENLAQFDASVETDLWGGQLALESEVPLFSEAISWVGRVSGGVYWMDADGRFSNSLTGKTLAPGQEETGYRLGAETGLRLFLGDNAYLTATGAVDHLSEAPRAVFRGGLSEPDEASGRRMPVEGSPARVGSDELTNYRANLRLTLTTQLHRAEPAHFK